MERPAGLGRADVAAAGGDLAGARGVERGRQPLPACLDITLAAPETATRGPELRGEAARSHNLAQYGEGVCGSPRGGRKSHTLARPARRVCDLIARHVEFRGLAVRPRARRSPAWGAFQWGACGADRYGCCPPTARSPRVLRRARSTPALRSAQRFDFMTPAADDVLVVYPWERTLGARPLGDGRAEFRVWAPNAERAAAAGRRAANTGLDPAGYGVREGVVSAHAGEDYVYVIDGETHPRPRHPPPARGPARP